MPFQLVATLPLLLRHDTFTTNDLLRLCSRSNALTNRYRLFHDLLCISVHQHLRDYETIQSPFTYPSHPHNLSVRITPTDKPFLVWRPSPRLGTTEHILSDTVSTPSSPISPPTFPKHPASSDVDHRSTFGLPSLPLRPLSVLGAIKYLSDHLSTLSFILHALTTPLYPTPSRRYDSRLTNLRSDDLERLQRANPPLHRTLVSLVARSLNPNSSSLSET